MLVGKDEPVTPRDIRVGQHFPVYGRNFFVYDADASTRGFYQEYLNIECEAMACPIPEDTKTHLKLRPPPHTGFGSEDDSLASCFWLVPKPPRQDLGKLMSNLGRVLLFECRAENGLPEDSQRRFIIGYFLSDDTIAVWELRQRNSGQVEGKFAERGVKYNPVTNRPIQINELFVGSKVCISAMPFLVVRADEFTLKYMEKSPATWPMSSIQQLAQKLQAVDYSKLPDLLGPDRFRAAIKEQVGVDLLDAEIVTMLRYCCAKDALAKGQTGISRTRMQEVMANPPEPGHLAEHE